MRNKPWDRSVQLTKLLFKIPFLLGGIELSNAGQSSSRISATHAAQNIVLNYLNKRFPMQSDNLNVTI